MGVSSMSAACLRPSAALSSTGGYRSARATKASPQRSARGPRSPRRCDLPPPSPPWPSLTFSELLCAWTTLATQALTDIDYTPDFTARVEVAARILIIARADVQSILGITGSPAGCLPREGRGQLGPDAEARYSERLSGDSEGRLSDPEGASPAFMRDLLPDAAAETAAYGTAAQPARPRRNSRDLYLSTPALANAPYSPTQARSILDSATAQQGERGGAHDKPVRPPVPPSAPRPHAYVGGSAAASNAHGVTAPNGHGVTASNGHGGGLRRGAVPPLPESALLESAPTATPTTTATPAATPAATLAATPAAAPNAFPPTVTCAAASPQRAVPGTPPPLDGAVVMETLQDPEPPRARPADAAAPLWAARHAGGSDWAHVGEVVAHGSGGMRRSASDSDVTTEKV